MKKILGLIFLTIWPALVWADVPKLLNYQGRLTNATNQAVADDDYTVQFRLYISAAEVNSVWDETQTISTQNGYFHTLVGQVNALTPSLFNQSLWLGIQVQGEAEMTPRQQLASSPAALTVVDGAISNSKVADGAISTDKVMDGAISANKLALDATLPIGTIVAWHKSMPGVPQTLPDNWAECNGQEVIDDKSPLVGRTIPNLNGASEGEYSPGFSDKERLFLRGGVSSGQGEMDCFQNHQHRIIPKNTFSINHTHSGMEGWLSEGCSGYSNGGPCLTDVAITGKTNDNETRPKSMSVVWIMKIK